MGDANVPDHFLRYDHEVTKSVVVDYIRYRLCKESLEWNSDKYFDSQQQRQPSKICLTMRTLASELEEKYRQTFNEMCNDLNITPASAENIFSAVTTELFNGGIQWGTIVALFAFAGCMAVKCQRTEMSVLIDSIADWIITYCDEKLQPWMNDHGAWEGFVDYFEIGSNREWTNQIMWPSLKNFFYGVAAGALGVLTLGAFMSSRS